MFHVKHGANFDDVAVEGLLNDPGDLSELSEGRAHDQQRPGVGWPGEGPGRRSGPSQRSSTIPVIPTFASGRGVWTQELEKFGFTHNGCIAAFSLM